MCLDSETDGSISETQWGRGGFFLTITILYDRIQCIITINNRGMLKHSLASASVAVWLLMIYNSSPWNIASVHTWVATWESVPSDICAKSNQPAHLCSPFKVVVVCIQKLCSLGYFYAPSEDSSSNYANAHAHRKLRFEGTFSDVAVYICYVQNIIMLLCTASCNYLINSEYSRPFSLRHKLLWFSKRTFSFIHIILIINVS